MPKVITEKLDRICVVTINRPESRNAIDRETADLLFEAFSSFDRDKDLDIAILTGAGGTFCAGADLKAIATRSDQAPKIRHEGKSPLGISRMQLKKPVIAAIEGHAVAGGLELALWCDLRVAGQDAIFGVYCRRIGVPLVDGGTIRLPRMIGHSHAMDLILTGRGVKGEEAKIMGLINRLVPNGEALEHAIQLGEELCKFPQYCLRSDRLSAKEQWSLKEKEAFENELNRGEDVLKSGEAIKGAIDFVNSRSLGQ